MGTYYREYNKECNETGDKTLVGNWVEERALRDTEETGRYKMWVNREDGPDAVQKTYTKKVMRPDGGSNLDTFSRTQAHEEMVPTAFWMTSNEVPDPGYRTYITPAKGVREAALERRAQEAAAAQIRAAVERESQRRSEFVSTHRADFYEKELPLPASIGRRRLGVPDTLWRVEAGVTSPINLVNGVQAEVKRWHGKDDTFSRPIELAKSGAEKIC